jgi:hypothetical protein
MADKTFNQDHTSTLQFDLIKNRVSDSKILTLDLELLHNPSERVLLDIKNWLFQEIILKEKEFRHSIKQHDWSQYKNKSVAVICSADAIVPTWAYMLVAIALQPYAHKQIVGSLEELDTQLYLDKLNQLDWHIYNQARVVIKGCSKIEVPTAIYAEVSSRLFPIASSIMFGEPCSTVPLYKRRATS